MTEVTLPSIAVILPVHNRAAAVTSAIDSILGQDYADFELIVVDDGSTDDTARVIEAIRDPRLKLIRLSGNQGGNAARNRGIEAANAPLLAFLDSDDAYLPHKLGVIVRTFRDRPDLDVLLDSFIRTYRPGRDQPDEEIRNPVIENNEELVEALFTRKIWKATPGISVRREAALRAGMFDEGLRRRQDFDFILRLAAVARCATTDQILWIKTYSSDSISAGLQNFAASTIEFYRRHPAYYSNPIFRRGFSHDLGRHFVRLLRSGKFAAARSDAAALTRELGPLRFVQLTILGAFRFRQQRKQFRKAVLEASGR
jgi:glycosyltransferase involved in cell wall biosynthesis